MRATILTVGMAVVLCSSALSAGAARSTNSVYTSAPRDPQAVYFTPERYGITNDGRTDVTAALQKAIDEVKEAQGSGVIFIPEGRYRITSTVYIPKSVRLFGYGSKRPVFYLPKRTPAFQQAPEDDKGQAVYMFWFVDHVKDGHIYDANAGTFYSAMSNIDIEIGEGNPAAVALRTHYAQHSFISHMHIDIGSGKAGIFDVGNEIEDVSFSGGDYGIYTTRTSPSWQFTMLNTSFEGQRRAAIYTEEGGWTVLRMSVKGVPVAIEVAQDRSDKIFLQDCTFEDISDAAIVESHEHYSPNQLSALNVRCSNVPTFLRMRRSEQAYEGAGRGRYVVREFTLGLHMDAIGEVPEHKTVCRIDRVKAFDGPLTNDIPSLPDVSEWVNVRDLGVVGDGQTDDTQALQQAIREHRVLYFPQGWYKLSEPLVLGEQTVLIGLNPISTQLFLEDSTPAFSGFGGPCPMIEAPKGGVNILNGLGINTGAYNYRAVGVKWMAGQDSYMNDVRFMGMHGSVSRKGSGKKVQVTRIPGGVSTVDDPVCFVGKDKAWDNQYWSLWITDGGGGVFKDIWTPDTYATSGLYVSDTSTPSAMYEISVEHHVRSEVRFKNVSNWRVYALQLEEEFRESADVQPVEIENCHNLMFANLYLFRVIWVDTPLDYAVRMWGSNDVEFYNVHNFTQMRQTTDMTLYDVRSGRSVRPWEFTRLSIKGESESSFKTVDGVRTLATGFEYIEGLTEDSKGNIYFSEQRLRRIYKYSPETGQTTLISDMPWPVLSLGCDTEDRLIAVVKYTPQPGYAHDSYRDLPDRVGSTYSWWGNTGFEPRAYSIDPDRPEETFTVLPTVPMTGVDKAQRVLYPSHRWRDLNDFDEVSQYIPESCFVALDGRTVIPVCYDLLRSCGLSAAAPGRRVAICDEYNHRTVTYSVGEDLGLHDAVEACPVGEFSAALGEDELLVADGYIYIYDLEGHLKNTIETPLRPTIIAIGRDGNIYAAARKSLYLIEH